MLDNRLVKIAVRETVERERDQSMIIKPRPKLRQTLGALAEQFVHTLTRKPEADSHRLVGGDDAFHGERIFLEVRLRLLQRRPGMHVRAIADHAICGRFSVHRY